MFNNSMFIAPGGMSKSAVEALIAESRITEILGS